LDVARSMGLPARAAAAAAAAVAAEEVVGGGAEQELTVRAGLAQTQVARFSMDGTAFESKRRASEEQYFANLAEEQRKKFAERLHEKELKELLQVLPPVRLAFSRLAVVFAVTAGCLNGRCPAAAGLVH
jgi:hypothetical protein